MDDSQEQRRQAPQNLTFDSDMGSTRSVWIAASLVVAIIAWMGSGFVLSSQEPVVAADRGEPQPVAAAVRDSKAAPVTLMFQAQGHALPHRDTAIRAEASGQIFTLLVDKGEDVKNETPIARLDVTQGEVDLRRAQEELSRARREFENAEKLLEQGVATTGRVIEMRALLAAAEAQVTTAEEALKKTVILAPFAGRIEALDVEAGEFIQAGSEIGRIVDNTPLTIAIQVPQRSLTRIRNGQTASIRFITGEQREGQVSFVATSAAHETRTFLAEIEVPNADGAIPAGISAEISIPTAEAMAHFVSPFVISLNASGEVGVKSVDQDNRVRFHPIQVVRTATDGVWVTGLPDTARIITIGQGFVSEGEIVRPVAEEPAQ